MHKIFSEDQEMVEQLRPDLISQQVSVRADLPQIAFRKKRKEYLDMGYGHDAFSLTSDGLDM